MRGGVGCGGGGVRLTTPWHASHCLAWGGGERGLVMDDVSGDQDGPPERKTEHLRALLNRPSITGEQLARNSKQKEQEPPLLLLA